MTLWAKEFGIMYDELTDIREIAEALAPHARKVLLNLARRLQKGQVQYGMLDLKSDTRNWRNEIKEELEDALVYMACEEVQQGFVGEGSWEGFPNAK